MQTHSALPGQGFCWPVSPIFPLLKGNVCEHGALLWQDPHGDTVPGWGGRSGSSLGQSASPLHQGLHNWSHTGDAPKESLGCLQSTPAFWPHQPRSAKVRAQISTCIMLTRLARHRQPPFHTESPYSSDLGFFCLYCLYFATDSNVTWFGLWLKIDLVQKIKGWIIHDWENVLTRLHCVLLL